MLSRELNKGHYLWPIPWGSWPNRATKHIVHAERMYGGYRQFDVRAADEDASGNLLQQDAHWLTFTQVRSNFRFRPTHAIPS